MLASNRSSYKEKKEFAFLKTIFDFGMLGHNILCYQLIIYLYLDLNFIRIFRLLALPTGYYCVNRDRADLCPTGYYCPFQTGADLQPCPAGKYNPIEGIFQEAQCTQCDGGKYCLTPSLSMVTNDCDAGYYCRSGELFWDFTSPISLVDDRSVLWCGLLLKCLLFLKHYSVCDTHAVICFP